MNDLERVNADLGAELPAAAATLSDLGRRAIFPRGIPYQSAQARGTRFNGTIGQVTDGAGGPMPLPALRTALEPLDPAISHLYSPPAGHRGLREAWAARQRRLSLGAEVPSSLPFFTGGLTQGLSFLAELFVDPGRPVLVPRPRWGNYDQTFGFRRGAELVPYELFDEAGTPSVEPLRRALGATAGPALLILNFPHNPTGFTPTPALAQAFVEVIADHPGPLVVIVDDAYGGMLYADDLQPRSMFWELGPALDASRHALFRVDGATKELLFFPGRVGFITAAVDPDGPAAAALESKLGSLARSSVGSPSGPGQAAVLQALQDPTLEAQIAAANRVLGERCQVLRRALEQVDSPYLDPLPFNSGVFALVGLRGVDDPDALRAFLIEHYDVGLVTLRDPPALRIAYCSVDADDLPELVERAAAGVAAFVAQTRG